MKCGRIFSYLKEDVLRRSYTSTGGGPGPVKINEFMRSFEEKKNLMYIFHSGTALLCNLIRNYIQETKILLERVKYSFKSSN